MKYLTSLLCTLVPVFILSCNNEQQGTRDTGSADSTITLPAGFSATVFADSLGKARHIAFGSNGDLYVKLEEIKDGLGILRLKDNNNDGIADDISGFGGARGLLLRMVIYMLPRTTIYIAINYHRTVTRILPPLK
jgi:hypothetical protein